MTDEEVLAQLKEADRLLAEYKKIAEPLAKELAKRKSIFVFGKEDGYRGHLGCQESGINTLCLHIQPDFMGEHYSDYRDKAEERPYDFEMEWARKTRDAGIEHLYISGLY